jgi:hypothetical protein
VLKAKEAEREGKAFARKQPSRGNSLLSPIQSENRKRIHVGGGGGGDI